MKADAPTYVVVGAAGGVDKEDSEAECLPMESSGIMYLEVYVFSFKHNTGSDWYTFTLAIGVMNSQTRKR